MEEKQEIFKEGDKVICIDDKGVCLTVGKSYVVESFFGTTLSMTNDISVYNHYHISRFIPFNETLHWLYL